MGVKEGLKGYVLVVMPSASDTKRDRLPLMTLTCALSANHV